MAKGLLTEDAITAEEAAVNADIQAAVERAEEQMKRMGDPLLMFEHACADMPSYLSEQREEFIRLQATLKKEEDHA
jgi:TPP-dependent pyruvate/acetoin dehydrogenase alpha subunit